MAETLADELLKDFAREQLARIVGHAEVPSELGHIGKLFTDYLDWRLHRFEFQEKAQRLLDNYNGKDKETVAKVINDAATQLIAAGRKTGRRYDINDLKTPQEIALIHSEIGEAGFKVDSEPYQPMILRDDPKTRDKEVPIDGISIGNLLMQRELLKHSEAHGFYFGFGENYAIKISLEPLDEKGRTVKDPIPLDERLAPIRAYTKSRDFPYRRG